MLELLVRLETLTPLATRAQREWMAARRADALYLAGDLSAAAGQAEAVHEPDYDRLASRLRSARGDEKRIRLAFRFIPQGFHTCGPATLAAIAQHWGMPVTQASIVEAIAYDGTYDQTERDWCESNGFAAREFKVTWDAARLLVDAGVPFALGTVEASSAHLQAVIGYDELRETLFIQDPGEPHYREAPAQDFLTRYALTGPRGMAVVPEARRSWLEALPLPEAALFDLNHAFHSALSAHRREEAVAALEQLETQEPGGRLALVAQLALTGFDGDTVERRCHRPVVDAVPRRPAAPRLAAAAPAGERASRGPARAAHAGRPPGAGPPPLHQGARLGAGGRHPSPPRGRSAAVEGAPHDASRRLGAHRARPVAAPDAPRRGLARLPSLRRLPGRQGRELRPELVHRCLGVRPVGGCAGLASPAVRGLRRPVGGSRRHSRRVPRPPPADRRGAGRLVRGDRPSTRGW